VVRYRGRQYCVRVSVRKVHSDVGLDARLLHPRHNIERLFPLAAALAHSQQRVEGDGVRRAGRLRLRHLQEQLEGPRPLVPMPAERAWFTVKEKYFST
jgi:hypothetical protein